MVVMTRDISCPRCPYQASSLGDLEGHGRLAHQPEATPRSPAPVTAPDRMVHSADRFSLDLTAAPIHPALLVPERDPNFWIDRPTKRLLHSINERSKRGGIVTVMVSGPTGTGKSSLPNEVAASWCRPFYTVHCQLVSEVGDWWGTKELSVERGTYFQKAALLDAVETPGCIILLDEANRTHPENLNALFGFLDHRRRAWIPDLHREVSVAPGVVFFVTLNEGADYVGTNMVDRALRDRISCTIQTDYLPKEIEAGLLVKRTGIDHGSACKLVEFARTVRNNPKLDIKVSTRQLLECSALAKEGLPLCDAVLFSIVNGTLQDLDRRALLQALQMTGEVQEAYAERLWDDDE